MKPLVILFCLGLLPSLIFGIDLSEFQGEWVSSQFTYLRIEGNKVTYEPGWYYYDADVKALLGPKVNEESDLFRDMERSIKYPNKIYRMVSGEAEFSGDTVKLWSTYTSNGAEKRSLDHTLLMKTHGEQLLLRSLNHYYHPELVYQRILPLENGISVEAIQLSMALYSDFCFGGPRPQARWGLPQNSQLELKGDLATVHCPGKESISKFHFSHAALDRLCLLLNFLPADLPSSFEGMVSDGVNRQIQFELNGVAVTTKGMKLPYLINRIMRIVEEEAEEHLKDSTSLR